MVGSGGIIGDIKSFGFAILKQYNYVREYCIIISAQLKSFVVGGRSLCFVSYMYVTLLIHIRASGRKGVMCVVVSVACWDIQRDIP